MQEDIIEGMPELSAVLSKTTARRLVRAVTGRMGLSSGQLTNLAKDLAAMAKEARTSGKPEQPVEGKESEAPKPADGEQPGDGETPGEDS